MSIFELPNASSAMSLAMLGHLEWSANDPRLGALENLIKAGKRFGATLLYDDGKNVFYLQHGKTRVRIRTETTEEIDNATRALRFAAQILGAAFQEMEQAASTRRPELQVWGAGLQQLYQTRFVRKNSPLPIAHRPASSLHAYESEND